VASVLQTTGPASAGYALVRDDRKKTNVTPHRCLLRQTTLAKRRCGAYRLYHHLKYSWRNTPSYVPCAFCVRKLHGAAFLKTVVHFCRRETPVIDAGRQLQWSAEPERVRVVIAAQFFEEFDFSAANGAGLAFASSFDLRLAREPFATLRRPLESKGDRYRISYI